MERNYRDTDGINDAIDIGSWKVWHDLSDDGNILTLKGEWIGDSRFEGAVAIDCELFSINDGKDTYNTLTSHVMSDLAIADHVWMLSDAVKSFREYVSKHTNGLFIDIE